MVFTLVDCFVVSSAMLTGYTKSNMFEDPDLLLLQQQACFVVISFSYFLFQIGCAKYEWDMWDFSPKSHTSHLSQSNQKSV